jgi:hypothetical protein
MRGLIYGFFLGYRESEKHEARLRTQTAPSGQLIAGLSISTRWLAAIAPAYRLDLKRTCFAGHPSGWEKGQEEILTRAGDELSLR